MWTVRLHCFIVPSIPRPNRAERSSLIRRDEASSLPGMAASTTARCLSPTCEAILTPARPIVAIFAAAFDRWDTDCFRRIVGDWAVSIWKPEQRELLFAADYMAIRHIFYYLKDDRIWWSTDLSPLVLLSGDKFHIDDDYIAGYLAHDPDAHLTPYREIREVPPGQFVRVRNGSVVGRTLLAIQPQVANSLQDRR